MSSMESQSDSVIPPLISVIIPVYNSANKLLTTLNSLADQNSPIWEAIVRDGSPDNTSGQEAVAAFLAANPSSSVKHIGGPDKGVYDAINDGIRASAGQYINVLGSGDYICEGAFQQISKILRDSYSDGVPTVVYGRTRRPNSDQQEGFEFRWTDFARKRNICHQTMFFSRSIFDIFGLYDIRYPIRSDNVLNIRLWADKRVKHHYVPMPLAVFEGGGLSDTSIDKPFHDDFPKIIAETYGLKGQIIGWLSDMNRKIRTTNPESPNGR